MNSQNNIIIGVLYRPPGTDISIFSEELNTICTRIKPERKICHMIGDYNINLLNAESHPPTQDFLNSMYSNSLFPVITKPTRVTSSSATLIDNLFTNAIANAQSFTGILYADVSDHFPIFYIDHSTKVKIPHKYIRKRIYSPENLQKFTDACDAHEWNNVLASNGRKMPLRCIIMNLLKYIIVVFLSKTLSHRINIENLGYRKVFANLLNTKTNCIEWKWEATLPKPHWNITCTGLNSILCCGLLKGIILTNYSVVIKTI